MLGFRIALFRATLAALILLSRSVAAQPAPPESASASFPAEPDASAPGSATAVAPAHAPPSNAPAPSASGATPPPPPQDRPVATPAAPPKTDAPVTVTSESSALAAGSEQSPAPVRSSRGPVVGLRLGYAMPFGNVADWPDGEMSNTFSGQLAALAELGWRPTPRLLLGGYVGVALGGAAGFTKDSCRSSDASCAASGARLGFELIYHVLPEKAADPWLGYGIGLEANSISQREASRKTTATFTGLEYARFTLGVDLRISPRFGIGPVLDYSIGNYNHLAADRDGDTSDVSLGTKAVHRWLTLGVRAAFYP
jgi:hypothetical protein